MVLEKPPYALNISFINTVLYYFFHCHTVNSFYLRVPFLGLFPFFNFYTFPGANIGIFLSLIYGGVFFLNLEYLEKHITMHGSQIMKLSF